MKNEFAQEAESEVLNLVHSNEIVTPAELLKWAKKNRNSATYRWLDSNDAFDQKKAAEQFALLLSRQLMMRVRVSIPVGDNQTRRVRGLVSLPSDRKKGGGYRALLAVLGDDELKEELLITVQSDAQAYLKRYDLLRSVAPYSEILSQMDALIAQMPSIKEHDKAGRGKAGLG